MERERSLFYFPTMNRFFFLIIPQHFIEKKMDFMQLFKNDSLFLQTKKDVSSIHKEVLITC